MAIAVPRPITRPNPYVMYEYMPPAVVTRRAIST